MIANRSSSGFGKEADVVQSAASALEQVSSKIQVQAFGVDLPQFSLGGMIGLHRSM